ncbi:MAG: NAD-dependent epimerase/dehydratase family protein, partial [Aureliella sp.]
MIFVTGGTGLLGNCIVRELCERSMETRVLCRSGSSRKPFDGLPVEIVEGDLNQFQVLDAAIAGCSAVIHCAAMIHIGWQKWDESRQVNVEGTRAVVEACLRHQCRLIHVSTVDTLPTARTRDQPIDESGQGGVPNVPCAYVVSKTEAEQLV